jgi:pilus assembly protein CpaC
MTSNVQRTTSGLVKRWVARAAAVSLGVLIVAVSASAQQPKMVDPLPKANGKEPPVLPTPTPTGIGRLQRLPGVPGPLGSTPVPSAKDLEDFNQFIGGVIDPKNTLDLIQGRARLIQLKATPTQTQIVDEAVVEIRLLGPNEITILGKRVGTTVFNLWFTDPKDKTKEKVLSYLVRVLPDPEYTARLEAMYKALEKEINQTFPNSRITLKLVGDKLVVSGQAHDIFEATQILKILRANAPGGQEGQGRQAAPVTNVGVFVNPNDPLAATGTPGQESYLQAGGPNVVNLMRIPGEQQVNLKVKVAEVNRAAVRSIGINFSIINNKGQTVFNQLTGGLQNVGTSAGNLSSNSSNSNSAGIANLNINLDGGQVPIALNALRTLNYARSLAEPNVTALNGETASFSAGGSFPVPVTGSTSLNSSSVLQGVQYVPYGVQLQFTPFITDRDRIRLQINAVVSTRDLSVSTQISGSSVAGLSSRVFTTTVELREGQTLAVAGLIQTNLAGDAQRVPFFGDLPFFGNLAGFNRVQAGEQELVMLITPELVHPLEPNELLPLPGSDVFEPGDLEFYCKTRLESRRSYDYRSPVRTDIHRMLDYRRCETKYILGPSGHSPLEALPVVH